MQDLYEAILGEKNRNYYLTKFEAFDQQGRGLKTSWNWPALLAGGVWALYRKMYGWFFAFWGVAFLSNIFEKGGTAGLSAIIFLVPWITFPIYADSLYHNSIKKKIAVAQLSVKEGPKLLEYLRYKGGVHTWVIWVFGLVPVIGILAAVAIPAYHDYTARAKTTGVPQSPSSIPSQPSNPVPSAPKWEDLSDTPPPQKPTSSAIGSHEIPRAGFNFDAEGNRLVNFDVNGALKAGYLKSEIAEYLCNERELDIAVIRGRGYSDDEIIAKLVAK